MTYLSNNTQQYKVSKGFTLIELLIVLVLIGLSSSLVMPAMWQQLEQTKYRAEIAKLKALSNYCRHYAYYKGAEVEVNVEDKTFTVSSGDNDEILRQLKFTTLSFEKKTIVFDSKSTFHLSTLNIVKTDGGNLIELSI